MQNLNRFCIFLAMHYEILKNYCDNISSGEKMNKTDEIASVFLGKKVEGSVLYDPSLLVAIPRKENREQYDINENCLPFKGYDVWHAYEFSCITKIGLPVTRVLKLRYNCNSPYIVESKSLKLYLNSFNMTKLGKDIKDCLELCKKTIKTDLSNKLQTDVNVEFLDNKSKKQEIFNNFTSLLNFIDENNIFINDFKENPDLIETEISCEKQYFLTFDSLRSNCRVTHQPDFGDIFIYYKSKTHIKENSLLKYLCSFRSEYHFHEECAEMIYKRLFDNLNTNDELLVCALYTRRGGIDICPVRWSQNCDTTIVDKLLSIKTFARHGIKQ